MRPALSQFSYSSILHQQDRLFQDGSGIFKRTLKNCSGSVKKSPGPMGRDSFLGLLSLCV